MPKAKRGCRCLFRTYVTTDDAGNATFTATLPTIDPTQRFITATATTPNNVTSTFSARLAIGDALGSVFVVNTADDHDDGVADATDTSLREAIIAANNHPGLDTIQFNIGSGVQTINPKFNLPKIIDPVIINATSQPGYQGSPLIVLTGTFNPSTYASDHGGLAPNGLQLVAGDSTIRGLVFEHFAAAIIGGTNPNGTLTADGGDVVQGNFIGTDVSGTLPAYCGDGIELGGSHNLIGGTTPEARNLISSNVFDSIILNGSNNQTSVRVS
jgi:CSLREA domain-containing protein